MSNKIPHWEHVGEHGAVFKDATGLIYGGVQRYTKSPTLWLGTAILGPEVAKLPGFLRGDPPRRGEPIGARSFDYPVTAGTCQITDSKEKAMEFVTKTLAEKGKL